MPSDTSVGRVIGNTLIQIFLLPLNFIIWLVTSPELITLLCILSEILIELVVSAVMAGVSIIVSAVILMEDDPEPTLIMTPPSYPKKSFLHGGDPTCIIDSEKEDKEKEVQDKTKEEDRKSVDKTTRRRSSSSRSLLDRWLPKYGAPRGDTPQAPEIEIPLVEGSEPESTVTHDSGETRIDDDAKSAEFEKELQLVTEDVDSQLGALAGEASSLKTDSEKADSVKADSVNADSVKADSVNADSVNINNEKTDTGSVKIGSENAVSAERGSGSEAAQDRLSIRSSKTER